MCDKNFPIEPVYTVTEVAEILGVDRHTIFKFLATDADGESIIDRKDWFKLPGGQIRVRKRGLDKLLEP